MNNNNSGNNQSTNTQNKSTLSLLIRDEIQPFIIAVIFLIAFFVIFGIAALTPTDNNTEILKVIGAILGGGLGTVLGYFFGSKQTAALNRRIEDLLKMGDKRVKDLEKAQELYHSERSLVRQRDSELNVQKNVLEIEKTKLEEKQKKISELLSKGEELFKGHEANTQKYRELFKTYEAMKKDFKEILDSDDSISSTKRESLKEKYGL